MSYVERVTVTPEVAKNLLQRNYDGNRRVRNHVVEKYSSDMASGMFHPDANGLVIVDKNGVMIDGQHRMLAIIATGRTYDMDIRFDADSEAFTMIDSGSARTAADVIGGKYSIVKAAISKIALEYTEGDLSLQGLLQTHGKRTKAETVRFFERNADRVEQAATYYESLRHSLRKSTPRVTGLCMYLTIYDYASEIQYIVDEARKHVPSDRSVLAYKMAYQDSILRETMTPEKQFVMLARLIKSVSDGGEFHDAGNYTRSLSKMDRMYKTTGRII